MIVCAAFYVVIAVLAGVERNWARVLYYLGALLITIAVLWMGFRAKPKERNMDEPTIAQQVAASADLLKQYRQHRKRGRTSEHVALIRAAGHVWFTLTRTCSAVPVSHLELVNTFGPKGGHTRKTPAVRVRWLAVQLMHRNGFSFPDIGVVLHQDHTTAVLAFHRYDNQTLPDWAVVALERTRKVLA